ncbi:YitT family protein [Paenibacillus chitinolyticus]|uniref:YitT family protein n=1 Tax=Paenibacillus chitinolyticus TaxID=79263 RepID=UPI00386753DB
MDKKAISIAVVILGAALVAFGFNMFLIPHELLSGGVSGIAMVIGYLTNMNISILYFVLNLPLIIWGLVIIGRRFIIISIGSVIATTWFMQIIPVRELVQEPILGAVFGGVLVGIGAGITMRAGGSTGGFDIVGSILTRKRDFPLGQMLFALNGGVIFMLGYFKNNWDLALFSMLSIYIAGKVIDTIHIRHIKVTAFIVTKQREALLEKLLVIPRGVTVIRTEGAYTNQEQSLLMTVTTRYELVGLQKIIKETDPKAFVNVVETVGVLGEFRRQ